MRQIPVAIGEANHGACGACGALEGEGWRGCRDFVTGAIQDQCKMMKAMATYLGSDLHQSQELASALGSGESAPLN